MSNTGVEITAGLGGFLVVFALALTVWLLSRDLTKRLRRMRLKEAARVEALHREAERDAGDDLDADTGHGPGKDPLG